MKIALYFPHKEESFASQNISSVSDKNVFETRYKGLFPLVSVKRRSLNICNVFFKIKIPRQTKTILGEV